MTHPDNLLDQPVCVYDDLRPAPVTAGILRRVRHGVYWIEARAPYYTIVLQERHTVRPA